VTFSRVKCATLPLCSDVGTALLAAGLLASLWALILHRSLSERERRVVAREALAAATLAAAAATQERARRVAGALILSAVRLHRRARSGAAR